MARGYQDNYSQIMDGAVFDRARRENKAKTIVTIVQDFVGSDALSSLKLLDVGAAAGFIDNCLADHFAKVVGVDIDLEAINYARKSFQKDNLEFKIADALALPFKKNEFEVVICTHIYEHVPDAQVLLDEIFRVLKPGGICYFAAGNRFSLFEPHYRLPFLSIIPRPLAHLYMKFAGRGNYYYEKHLLLSGLKKLVNKFIVHDYTKKLIHDPERFHGDYMLKPGSIKQDLAKFVADYAYWLCPTYIWILQKPDHNH